MYYSYFGLSQPPFRITPDTDFFFEGANRGAVLEALVYAITQGEGIVKVVGEVGSGKTMLCRVLQARLPKHVESVYLANPSVSPEEILHAIGFELQLPITREASRLEVMHALNEYLLARHAQGRQVVVFVEESQSMPIPSLEEIRLLSNLETKQHKLLQIVLFGQPELDVNLARNEIRQLRDRITHSFSLGPLRIDDVHKYLSFRLRAAGYRGPELFSPEIARQMAKASAGLTRRVNILADKTLLAAFADGTHNIKKKHLDAAAADSEFAAGTGFRWRIALVGAACLIAAAVAWVGYRGLVVTKPPINAAAGNLAPGNTQSAIAAPPPSPPAPPPLSTPAVNSNPAIASAEAFSDPLELRLSATHEWLAKTPGNLLSIQLLGSGDLVLFRRYFDELQKSVELEKIFVYRTRTSSGPSVTLLYGTFSNRTEALQALDALPPGLRTNRPYIRTADGIRLESVLSAGESRTPN
ncbi:MAG: ExeA family protein [Burkholderiales bacterium]